MEIAPQRRSPDYYRFEKALGTVCDALQQLPPGVMPRRDIDALALGLLWTRKYPEVFQPGRSFLHPSLDCPGLLIATDANLAKLDFGHQGGGFLEFPLDELAFVGAVELAEEKLTSNERPEFSYAKMEAATFRLLVGG